MKTLDQRFAAIPIEDDELDIAGYAAQDRAWYRCRDTIASTLGDITIRTNILAPPELCFDLARNVSVHAESAAFSNERLVAPGKLDGILDVGDLVCFEGRHFGVRQRFCAKITHVERPRVFVDEMVEGIFSWLRHVHEFEAVAGGTVMVDRLVWKAPLGLLGSLADWLFLERHMAWFVRTKQNHLKRIAEETVHRRGAERAEGFSASSAPLR